MDCLEGRVVLSRVEFPGPGAVPGPWMQAQYGPGTPGRFGQATLGRFGQAAPGRFSPWMQAQASQATPAPTAPDPSGQASQTTPAPTNQGLPIPTGQGLPGPLGPWGGAALNSPMYGRGLAPFGGFRGPHGGSFSGGGGGFTQDAQLTQDLKTLQTDLNTVRSSSNVTDAERLALRNDFQQIANSGISIDRAGLTKVADDLLTALADGSYDSKQDAIKASFTALFTPTSTSATGLTSDQSTLVNKTFDDFKTVAGNLGITSDELTTLASDRSAIQADFQRLGINTPGNQGPGGSSSNLNLIVSPGVGHFRGGPF